MHPDKRTSQRLAPTGVLAGLLLISLFLHSGCTSQAEENDPKVIREQISTYQSQINELTLRINELDRLLEQMGERPRSRSQVPVTVIQVQPGSFEQFIQATASVEAVQSAVISPETNGQIQSIPVAKGQRVGAGQVVARLNSQVLESNIQEVLSGLELARTVYERQKGLWDQQIGSEMQYLEARNAVRSLETRLKTLESQLDMSVMRAPFAGIVDDIFLKEGELAMPGSRVMNLINLESLYVNADISESFLGAIGTGDPVILRFPAYPGQDMHVPVHRIGHVINPENRTFRVQLLIGNTEDRFKPNMMANLSIPVAEEESVYVVPSILVKQDIQGHFVYTAQARNGDLVAAKTYIERGPDGEGNTLVRAGLQSGMQLIDKGHNQVADGTLLRIEQGREDMATGQ